MLKNMVKGKPGAKGDGPNPFRFIELALQEAKGKIEKMKAKP